MPQVQETKIRAVQFQDNGRVSCLDSTGKFITMNHQVSVEKFLADNLDKKRIDDSTKIFHFKIKSNDVRGAKQELRIKPRWWRAIFGS